MNLQKLFCPYCGKELEYPESLMGSLVQCTSCSSYFVWGEAKNGQGTQHPVSGEHSAQRSEQQRPIFDKSKQPLTQMLTRKSWIVASAVVLIGILGTYVYYSSTRYQIVNHDNVVYRIDRHTGEMAMIKRGKLTAIEEPEKAEDRKIRRLSSVESSEITGRASVTTFGSFSGDMYNGNSSVVLTEFTVSIQYKNKNDESDVISRKYKCNAVVRPLQSSHFSVSVLGVDNEYEFKGWSYFDAKGYDANSSD